jgi:hypothetical protein
MRRSMPIGWRKEEPTAGCVWTCKHGGRERAAASANSQHRGENNLVSQSFELHRTSSRHEHPERSFPTLVEWPLPFCRLALSLDGELIILPSRTTRWKSQMRRSSCTPAVH